MADRQDSDREVLTSLPRSRPVRRSTKRDARPTVAQTARTTSASSKPAAPKKRATTPRRKTGAATAGAAKPRTTTTPAATARGASTARPRPAAKRPRPDAAARREREPERVAPARKVPPAGYAAPTTRSDHERGSGAAELLSTAVQAANELTQIGLTVGRQALQSMLDRLPKP